MPRAWTVELRSHTSGLFLVCQQCPHEGGQVTAASARSAALAHLARHARGDLIPPHLRICQCHERGCRWHTRHRGCDGPIRLLLACERGGRVWRLADACSACAAATAQAAVVPDTAFARSTAQQPAITRRRTRHPKGPGEQIRVREMLSYLATALPPDSSAAARLLALQCALRMSTGMRVRLPKGVLRSLRLDTPSSWRELEHARWLRTTPESTTNEVVAELLDITLLEQAPARPDRMHAADWALRVSSKAGAIGPLSQLTCLYLAVHSEPELGSGQGEADHMARVCGTRPAELPNTLVRLAATGLLKSWQACLKSGDLHWTLVRGWGLLRTETGKTPTRQ